MTQPIPPEQVPQEQIPPPESAPEEGDSLGAIEIAVAALVFSMLKRWLRKTRNRVMAPHDRFRVAPDPDAIMFAAQEWVNLVDDELMPELAKILQRGYRKSAPTRRRAPSAQQVMLTQLRRARNLLVRIPDEIYAEVNAELVRSAALGEDVYHQARRVDNVLNATGSENWPNRAKVIAVTEVNRAHSAGILLGGFQAQIDEGRTLYKRWDSSNDSRVREWHRVADGQTVPLGTAFDVGPDRLQHPGDPDGLPSNVISCRCTLDIVDGDEIRGR